MDHTKTQEVLQNNSADWIKQKRKPNHDKWVVYWSAKFVQPEVYLDHCWKHMVTVWMKNLCKYSWLKRGARGILGSLLFGILGSLIIKPKQLSVHDH